MAVDFIRLFDGGGRAVVDREVNGVANLSIGVSSAGTLAIAASGAINVGDDYNQTAAGELQYEIANSAIFGKLTVEGDAFLAGGLRVSLQGAFLPEFGDEFTFIAAAGLAVSLLAGFFSRPQPNLNRRLHHV